jgi:acyl-CoA dehydrogenase
MKRTIFSPEHEIFRQSVRAFFQREVLPNQERWAEQGMVDREVWRKAGAAGLLCPWLPESEGGPGGDLLHSLVIIEEQARVYESGLALSLHSDIVVPYLVSFADEALKRRYLPGCISGDIITAIAMTEPGTGSDLAAIATTARRTAITMY